MSEVVLRYVVDVVVDDKDMLPNGLNEYDELMQKVYASSFGPLTIGVTGEVNPKESPRRGFHIHRSSDTENCPACIDLAQDEIN